MKKKPLSDVMAAIHETAVDLYEAGGMDRETMRKFDALCLIQPSMHHKAVNVTVQ